MTFAEFIRQEGRQEGRDEGFLIGQIAAYRELLRLPAISETELETKSKSALQQVLQELKVELSRKIP
jgi:hypothetical protein